MRRQIYVQLCNNGENSKPPMHAAPQYVTMVAYLAWFCSLSSLIIDYWLEHSPVTRAAGDRNPAEAWNFRIIYVNAHAQYGS